MTASTSRPLIAVTVGEPSGIGPELCARLGERAWAADLVLIGDRTTVESRALACGLGSSLPAYAAEDAAGPGPGGGSAMAGDDARAGIGAAKTAARVSTVSLLDVPLAAPSVPGRPDPANAHAVLAMLDRAIDGCVSGRFAAMVTAPVHKAVINDAGVPFTGHTEYLAERLGAPRVVMLLVGGGLRVALATTHLPLSVVSSALTHDGIVETLRIVDRDFRRRFAIPSPRIAVCGLNPHAGEGGHLGREEIEVIGPAIATARAAGIGAVGPFPADTIFVPAQASRFDCVLAMFHDQGLPVLKHASFGHGVNVTLGLTIVRTSVDHGTALDIAGTGRADPGSLFAAVDLAIDLARHGTVAD